MINEESLYGIYDTRVHKPTTVRVITGFVVNFGAAETKHDLIYFAKRLFNGKTLWFHFQNMCDAIMKAATFEDAFEATKKWVYVSQCPTILLGKNNE